MDAAVSVKDLVKVYKSGQEPAVDGLGFSVRRGEVFGLLGPNGAGKTTTVGVLTTRVRPTSGTALVEGVDVVANAQRARQLLAVVPQRNNLDRALNVRQNLLFHAAYHGIGRVERRRLADEVLERMGLSGHATNLVDTLSGGQAQRLMIARALMHRPKVLFLDEPSTGLDPQARLFVHDRVAALHADGVTVVLTTHDMDEAEKLCDRVGIVDHGKLLALDSPGALTRTLPGSTTIGVTVTLDGTGPAAVADSLAGLDGVERVERVAAAAPAPPPGAPPAVAAAMAAAPPQQNGTELFRLYTDTAPAVALPEVLSTLERLGTRVTDLAIGRPSLEDVFIHLTGRELR